MYSRSDVDRGGVVVGGDGVVYSSGRKYKLRRAGVAGFVRLEDAG